MSIKIRIRLEDHLWYPIVIKDEQGTKIVEMLGKDVNEWNDKLDDLNPHKRIYPRNCI